MLCRGDTSEQHWFTGIWGGFCVSARAWIWQIWGANWCAFMCPPYSLIDSQKVHVDLYFLILLPVQHHARVLLFDSEMWRFSVMPSSIKSCGFYLKSCYFRSDSWSWKHANSLSYTAIQTGQLIQTVCVCVSECKRERLSERQYLSMITGSEGVSLRFPQLFLSQHRLQKEETVEEEGSGVQCITQEYRFRC